MEAGLIVGNYVKKFADATHGMLVGLNLNGRYPFFFVRIVRVDGRTLVCTANGVEHRLKIGCSALYRSERCTIENQDGYKLFPPQKFVVLPFKGKES